MQIASTKKFIRKPNKSYLQKFRKVESQNKVEVDDRDSEVQSNWIYFGPKFFYHLNEMNLFLYEIYILRVLC